MVLSYEEFEARRRRNQELWDSFIARTYPLVRRLPLPDVPAAAERAVVMVETRPHPHMEYVLRNALHFLGPGWSVCLFVGTGNRRFVEDLVGGWGAVRILQMQMEGISAPDYSRLKKTAALWRGIGAGHVLWMEPDAILRRRGIDDFMDYDYVGAPWRSGMSVSPMCRVGNGGLSLRRSSTMVEICETCNTDPAVLPQEDIFFCINMKLFGAKYRVAPLEVAERFAVESVYSPDPLGLHKPWVYLESTELKTLLDSVDY